jgi:hypothetical protein
MAGFLDNYEDVNSRIKRFRSTYPQNQIITEVVNFQPENGWILVRADIWVSNELIASDFAYGDRQTYPSNMQKWYVEDTVTSAVGRAIALVMDVDHKATKQNMARVEQPKKETIQVASDWDNFVSEKPVPQPMDTEAIAASLGGEIIEEIPNCGVCNRPMHKREGTKDGKAYFGYVCPLPKAPHEKSHPAKWYDLTPSGKWVYKPRKG